MNNFEKLAKRGGAILSTAIIAVSSMSGIGPEKAQAQENSKDIPMESLESSTSDEKLAEIKILDNGEIEIVVIPEKFYPPSDVIMAQKEQENIERNNNPMGSLPTEVINKIKEEQNIERNNNPTGSIPTEVIEFQKAATEAEQRKIPSVVIYRGDTSEKEIAFTFDDTGANFDKILATLKEKGINGTFFLLASEIRNNPERWQQAVADGNLICSHGTSHNFSLGNQSEEAIRADIQGWEDAVTEVLGADYLAKFKEETPYFRTPGGNKTDTLLKVLGEMGYKYTFYWTTEDCWSMDPINNPDGKTMEQIYINGAEPGAIFLLHPPHQSHVGEIIDEVKVKGYIFVTLGEWGGYYETQTVN